LIIDNLELTIEVHKQIELITVRHIIYFMFNFVSSFILVLSGTE